MKQKTSKYLAALIIVLGLIFIYFIFGAPSPQKIDKYKEAEARKKVEQYIYKSDSVALFDNIKSVPIDGMFVNLYGRCVAAFNSNKYKTNENYLIIKIPTTKGEPVPDKLVYFKHGSSGHCYWHYYDRYNHYWSFDEIKEEILSRKQP